MRKEIYFDFMHTFITMVVVFDALTAINLQHEYISERIMFNIGIGFFIGIALSFIWEFIIEEGYMNRSSSRHDIVNMVASGIVAGVLCLFVTLPFWVLASLSTIAIFMILNELWNYYKQTKN